MDDITTTTTTTTTNYCDQRVRIREIAHCYRFFSPE